MKKLDLVLELIVLGVIIEEQKDSFLELDETILNALYENAVKKSLSPKDIDTLLKNKKIDEVIKKSLGENLEAKRRAIQEKNEYANKIKFAIETLQNLL